MIRYGVLFQGRFRSLNRFESRGANRIACLVPRDNDSDCFSNDLFAGMRFLHLRPVSVDARREWEEDTSSPNGWTKHWDTGEQAPYVMGSWKTAERGDRSDVTSHRAARMAGLSRRRGIGWNESERIA